VLVSTDLVLLSAVSYRGREIAGRRLGGLLALLAADLRTGCGTARLISGLWPDEQPENPTKALQVLVSRARAQLGSDLIASTPTGYRLALSEDQVDSSAVLLRAAASARQSRAGDHAAALADADSGLSLWAGAPGGDLASDDPVSALRAERATTYRSLVRARALALAQLGRHAEAIEPLSTLARELPRDEEVLLELLRCEAATVGPSAALTRYEEYRRALRDELGTDPGVALQTAYHQLLAGDAPEVRHGVPYEPNPLLGRADDIVAVANLVRTSRVTSIVGPGGLGKTRLAQAVSRAAEQRVVYLVPLAGVTTDDEVVRQVASALGAGEPRRGLPPDVLTGMARALGPGPALLVLDNCEQVIRGVTELVQALVSTTPDVRVLTTSRSPLGLSSEAVYALPQLSLSTMVELFEQRARAARPGVELPADVVRELCRHLDGLPLAVELAAARVRVLSVAEIADRLSDRFALLRGGPRDAPQRHQTLHAVVDWSWHLLEPAGQAAMRALSVFPGGFAADAAGHLLGGDVIDVLANLADQSLLQVADTGSGARFRMLETVREFSASQRETAGETDRAVAGFLDWARDFGMAHHDTLFAANPMPAMERIRAEQDNLVQALRLAAARDDGATVAGTTAVLASLWLVEANYGRMTELTGQAGRVLSHYRPAVDLVEVTRTAAVLCTAFTFSVLGPTPVRSLVVLRRLPPVPPETVVRAAATVLAATPELLRADAAALRVMLDSDKPLLTCVANIFASYVWEYRGEGDRALAAAERTREALRDQPAPWARLLADARVADLCLQVGQGERALPHLAAAMSAMDELGVRNETLGLRFGMVLAYLQVGRLDEAERLLAQVEPEQPEDSLDARTFALTVRAEILLARDELEAGLRLLRRAAGLLRETVERGEVPGYDAWSMEVDAATVVAHARHGRLGQVAPLVAALPDRIAGVLATLAGPAQRYLMSFPVCGALLLALATVDLDRGAVASGVRLTALAERFHLQRGFLPSMSAAQARQEAEQADKAAYADAVSEYAALSRDELPAAALAALRVRAAQA
jgi:predicted ATPase/DNA-binding SARP family transcriptional activator